MEKGYIKIFRYITILSSMVLIVLIITVWIRESWKNEWKGIQKEYAGMTDEHVYLEKNIQQIVLQDLDRTDRCITCHPGIENPLMAGAQQPYSMHPGPYLEQHPLQKYGCTVCHGGQGRAVSKQEAFGQDPELHWDRPLLRDPYIQSSCGKCHSSIFSGQAELKGTEVFDQGREIFKREGCLGCHKARSVGGTVGPDLTQQGEKTRHEYSFQNVRGDQTISNWLKEHFIDPEMVSPGSQMLTIDLPEEELDALATFVMGLARPGIPFDYLSIEALNEFKGLRDSLNGQQCYGLSCSACHGKAGEGKDYKTFEMGVPAIYNRDFLSIASGDFLFFTLQNGRGRRMMASWAPRYSGLYRQEVDSLVLTLQASRDNNASGAMLLRDRSVVRGRLSYAEHCSMCHGENGSGGLAPAISNEGFLEFASEQFIYNTLLHGRNNTAMPSWSYLDAGEVADLLAFTESWRLAPYHPVRIEIPQGDTIRGGLRFHYLCSRCHGEFGEGDTGPAILNKDLFQAADDSYLYRTISQGRAHTAMFGWATPLTGDQQLGEADIADIIAYMRSMSRRQRDYIYPGSNPGNRGSGRILFQAHCAECHGEEGEGPLAPALNNQEFLNAATNGYLLGTITLGRTGTKMPSWGKGTREYPFLTDKERQDLAALIRSWQRISIKLK